MLLHVVEDCPCVHQRFLRGGGAAVLPYANGREGSVFRHVGELGEGLGNLAERLQIDGEASNGAGGEGLLARKVTDDDVVVGDDMLRIVGMVCRQRSRPIKHLPQGLARLPSEHCRLDCALHADQS